MRRLRNCVTMVLLVWLAGGCEKHSVPDYDALCEAVRSGDLVGLQALVERGGDVNARGGTSQCGYTVLHVAAVEGNLEIVKFLIAKGAKVNVPDDYGDPPLNCAIGNHQQATVEFLIASGADVNFSVEGGPSPLYTAARGGYEDTIALLIAKGAKVIRDPNSTATPLHEAAGWG